MTSQQFYRFMMLFATNELPDPQFTWPLTFVGYRMKLYLSSKVFAGRNIRFIRRHFHKCKPGIQREQALADISRSALCCHSNETRAPIANPGPCSSMGMRRGTDKQTHRVTQTCVTNIHFAASTTHAKLIATQYGTRTLFFQETLCIA